MGQFHDIYCSRACFLDINKDMALVSKDCYRMVVSMENHVLPRLCNATCHPNIPYNPRTRRVHPQQYFPAIMLVIKYSNLSLRNILSCVSTNNRVNSTRMLINRVHSMRFNNWLASYDALRMNDTTDSYYNNKAVRYCIEGTYVVITRNLYHHALEYINEEVIRAPYTLKPSYKLITMRLAAGNPGAHNWFISYMICTHKLRGKHIGIYLRFSQEELNRLMDYFRRKRPKEYKLFIDAYNSNEYYSNYNYQQNYYTCVVTLASWINMYLGRPAY
jgi:hypothetical protein